MAKTRSDLLQGALDLLILKTLSKGALHGYGIAERIEQVSDEVLRVEEGSLYPALHRLEQSGVIRSEWRMSEHKRRARFYELTEAGRTRLTEEEREWERITKAVATVLRFV